VENQYLKLQTDTAEADHPQTALLRCNTLGNEAMIAYLQYKRLAPDAQAAQRLTTVATIRGKAAEIRVQASEMQRLAKLTAVRLRSQLAGTGNQSAVAILQQAMATYSDSAAAELEGADVMEHIATLLAADGAVDDAAMMAQLDRFDSVVNKRIRANDLRLRMLSQLQFH
jgi:hypothetical protein